MSWTKQQMAQRAVREIAPRTVVNLGIGLPTLVADLLPAASDVMLHSENGLLGMGPFPVSGTEDAQVINAGKQTVTVRPGGSFFDSATNFAMIRGGHVDLAILGALQVGANGDLANWQVPGGRTMGIGGAMDLAAGAHRVVVLTRHLGKDGTPKLLGACTYPLTGCGVVHRVITDLGVLDPCGDHFDVVALAPGVTPRQAEQATGVALAIQPCDNGWMPVLPVASGLRSNCEARRYKRSSMSTRRLLFTIALCAGCGDATSSALQGALLSSKTLSPGCVGSPYTSVQDAIDDAVDGDTVEICAGTYLETLSISGLDLTLRSADGLPSTTTIDANRSGRALEIRGGSSVLVEGLTFLDGDSSGTGANVYCTDSAVELRDSVLEGGDAGKGGGLGSTGCDGTVAGSTFLQNDAETYGGGIYVKNGVFTVENSVFDRNDASSYGGGLYATGGLVTVQDNVFEGNDSGSRGGGVYFVGSSVLINNTLDSNSSNKGGGAYVRDSDGDILGNQVLENTSSNDGAGIYVDHGQPHVDGNYFEGNDAGEDSGGLRIKVSEATITNNTFVNNHADADGGAMKISHDEVVMNGNTFVDNTALGRGGAVYMFESASVLTFETYIDNDAVRGGALAVGSGWGDLILEDCHFESIHSSYAGGLLHLGLPNHTTTLRRVTMKGGTASYGGAIYAADSNIHFENMLFEGNEATSSGAAMYLDDIEGHVRNAVLHDNTSQEGAGISVRGGRSSFDLLNIAFHENTGGGAAVDLLSGTAPGVEYSAFDGNSQDFDGMSSALGVDGNLSAAPLFVDEAGGDFNLQAGSTLIDAGDPGLSDLDGTRSDIGVFGGPDAAASTPPPPDTTAPTTPMNLASTAHTTTTIDLVWDASTDDVGVAGYRVYGPGGSTTDVPGTSHVVVGLADDTDHDFQVSALDAAGNESVLSSVLTVHTDVAAGVFTFSVQVGRSADDAEEKVSSGAVRLTSSDLDITETSSREQRIGLRFDGLAIPVGAIIQSATVQFVAEEAHSGATAFEIFGEATDDAAAFSTAAFDVTSRPTTAASALWAPASWLSIGDDGSAQRTTDLSGVLQEIVDRPGWASGQAVALLIQGTGRRVAETYDGSAVDAPLLTIEYTL